MPTATPTKPPTGNDTCCMCDYEDNDFCGKRTAGVNCIEYAECSDGKDNDNDGAVDMADSDCHEKSDTVEGNSGSVWNHADCDELDGKCVSRFKKYCYDFVKALGGNCTKTTTIPNTQHFDGTWWNSCKTVYQLSEGHSAAYLCPAYIDKLRICVQCTGPECQINALNNGCATFSASSEVERYTSNLQKLLSQHQKLYVSGNQSISSKVCNTYTTKIITSSGIDSKYGPCLGGGLCYRSSDQRENKVSCMEDGKQTTMVCCPSSERGEAFWELGDTCPQLKTVQYTCSTEGTSAISCERAETEAWNKLVDCMAGLERSCVNDGGKPGDRSPRLLTTSNGFRCKVVMDQSLACKNMRQ